MRHTWDSLHLESIFYYSLFSGTFTEAYSPQAAVQMDHINLLFLHCELIAVHCLCWLIKHPASLWDVWFHHRNISYSYSGWEIKLMCQSIKISLFLHSLYSSLSLLEKYIWPIHFCCGNVVLLLSFLAFQEAVLPWRQTWFWMWNLNLSDYGRVPETFSEKSNKHISQNIKLFLKTSKASWSLNTVAMVTCSLTLCTLCTFTFRPPDILLYWTHVKQSGTSTVHSRLNNQEILLTQSRIIMIIIIIMQNKRLSPLWNRP